MRVILGTVAGEEYLAVVAFDTTSTDNGDDDDDLDDASEYEGGDDAIDENKDRDEDDRET